jgi:sporulation protein YlmC with PRC-barrel domain
MSSRLELKVGLFVFIGLALLALLMIQFSKGMTFFRPTYTILLKSPNVSGLKVRAAVLMSGVQVGTVSDIKLAEDSKSVTITLTIYSRYAIHKDAKFIIDQSGFLGDQYVAIMPTENKEPPFQNGDVAQAEAPFNMQEVARAASGFVLRVDETAKRLNETIADVRRLFLNEQTLTNLSAAVVNARLLSERGRTTVERIDAVVETNSPGIAASISNLVVFSRELNRFATNLGAVLETNSSEFSAAMRNVEDSTTILKGLMEDVQAGKGLAGHLIRNEQVADNVAQITRNLSITSSNLNRLGLWGILWKTKESREAPPPSAERPLPSPKNPFEQ